MTETADLTVRDLLPDRLQELDQAAGDAVSRNEALNRRLPGSVIRALHDRISGALLDALDVKVVDILAGAWAKAAEIRRYRTPGAEHPAGKEIALFLGEHELTATLHPVVELRFEGFMPVEIIFDVPVTATLKAAEVIILDRHIVAVGGCQGMVGAEITCASATLHSWKSREFRLIDSHRFKLPGWYIP